MEKQKLSDEALEQVTGGAGTDMSETYYCNCEKPNVVDGVCTICNKKVTDKTASNDNIIKIIGFDTTPQAE